MSPAIPRKRPRPGLRGTRWHGHLFITPTVLPFSKIPNRELQQTLPKSPSCPFSVPDRLLRSPSGPTDFVAFLKKPRSLCFIHR